MIKNKNIKNNDGESQRPIIDITEVARHSFEIGKGIVHLQSNMPDAALVLAINYAASFGKAFLVVPSCAAKPISAPESDNGPYKYVESQE